MIIFLRNLLPFFNFVSGKWEPMLTLKKKEKINAVEAQPILIHYLF